MTPTLPAWKLVDDIYVYVYHAKYPYQAKNEHASEFGLDRWEKEELTVSRCRAMDGLEVTTYNLMVTGVIHYAEEHCICGATINAYDEGDGELFLSSMDPEYGVEARRAVLSGQSGELYCSHTCLWKAEGIGSYV